MQPIASQRGAAQAPSWALALFVQHSSVVQIAWQQTGHCHSISHLPQQHTTGLRKVVATTLCSLFSNRRVRVTVPIPMAMESGKLASALCSFHAVANGAGHAAKRLSNAVYHERASISPE